MNIQLYIKVMIMVEHKNIKRHSAMSGKANMKLAISESGFLISDLVEFGIRIIKFRNPNSEIRNHNNSEIRNPPSEILNPLSLSFIQIRTTHEVNEADRDM